MPLSLYHSKLFNQSSCKHHFIYIHDNHHERYLSYPELHYKVLPPSLLTCCLRFPIVPAFPPDILQTCLFLHCFLHVSPTCLSNASPLTHFLNVPQTSLYIHRPSNILWNKSGRSSSFWQKTVEDFFARKRLRYFYLPATQNEPIFSVSTSPNSTEITKLVLNICLCMLFAMTSKVRKKRKNFKINRKGRRFSKKTTKKAEDLPIMGRSVSTASLSCPHTSYPTFPRRAIVFRLT